MHNDGINNTLRRANRKLVTPQKGNHGIRKTYISTLDAYSDLTDEEIRQVAGHKYISTTQNCYMYSVKRPESRVIEFEKALGRKSVTPGVTPCYPNSEKKENAGNA
jgi:integrase